MNKPEPLQLQRISVFMPQRLRDDEIERLFIMRQDIFQTLLDSIKSEKATSIPQHHLIIGQRGMGKTTLLKRLDVELRKAPHNKKFVPFSFPEEQYNIDRLSKFWLNSLDALADTLQTEGDEAEAFRLDEQIAELSAIRNEQELSQKAYESLRDAAKSLSRRPVFLLDNLNLIFDRLGEVEQSKLRKLITEPGAPIFIGASPEVFDEDLQYDAPFYDAFAIHYLYKLDFRQTLTMLRHLGEITDQKTLLSQLTAENMPRLETLHALTGGNVRTVVILFSLVAQGFSADVFQDLEALIDQMTPLYKSRFEELAPQAQVVVDAVALNWDPCKLETLRERTSLENNQLSVQLDRLAKSGWISKLGKRKTAHYEISERFFNVWYLMRRATRRQRQDMVWLTRFMQAWFTRPELVEQAKEFMRNMQEKESEHELAFGLALARALPNQTGEKLKEKIYARLLSVVKGEIDKLEKWMGVDIDEINYEATKEFRSNVKYEIQNEGSIAILEGNWEKAYEFFINAFQANPKSVDAWKGIEYLFQQTELYIDDQIVRGEKSLKKVRKIISTEQNTELRAASLKLDEMIRNVKAGRVVLSFWFVDLNLVNHSTTEKNRLHNFVIYMKQALVDSDSIINVDIEYRWHCSAAVAIRLGYGEQLQAIFRETGHDRIWRPFYEAIKALTLNSEGYLKTEVAAEVREVALQIFKFMQDYNNPAPQTS